MAIDFGRLVQYIQGEGKKGVPHFLMGLEKIKNPLRCFGLVAGAKREEMAMCDRAREREQMEGSKRFVPDAARVESGRILCPYCGGFQGRAYYEAHSGGIEMMCINKKCKKFYRLDL